MDPELRVRMRGWLERLTVDPIDPTDERYVALQEAGRGAVDSIFSYIDLSFRPTTQLLSGPNGSGKTTELRRLKLALEEAGFTVVLVDILGYLSQSAEVDVTEFLIALGLSFGEQMLPDGGEEAREGFSARFRQFLQRARVALEVGPVSVSASGEGVSASVPGVSLDIDVKRELRSSKPFVDELREKLAFQLGQLYDEVAEFCQGLVAKDKERRPDSRGVVMIIDSLEKLRGTTETDERVQASVQRLFVQHSDKLRFASHHMVYSVPPYLMFTDTGALPYDGAVRPVHVPQVRDREEKPFGPGIAQMTEVIARRIPNWEDLLGSETLLRKVILASGGHLRDLFRILQEVITSAYGRGAPLPVDEQHVDDAISRVAYDFSNVTEENAAFMLKVHQAHGEVMPKGDEVACLARLLDTHMLLAHLNSEAWYEVHPLARRTLGLE